MFGLDLQPLYTDNTLGQVSNGFKQEGIDKHKELTKVNKEARAKLPKKENPDPKKRLQLLIELELLALIRAHKGLRGANKEEEERLKRRKVLTILDDEEEKELTKEEKCELFSDFEDSDEGGADEEGDDDDDEDESTVLDGVVGV